jgi:3-oxoadipate enol-lactonase
MSEVRTVKAGGQEIAYRQEGKAGAPTVLLSHSVLSDHRMWDALVQRLAPEYSVLRYDTRGHGGSSAPPAPYTLAQLADDVPLLLDALGLQRVHFIGTSMGGMIGQQLGARHSGRLLSLTLACTGAVQGAPAMWEERVAVARSQGIAALAEPTLERWFSQAYRDQNPAVIEHMRRSLLATSVEGYAGCALAIRDLAHLDLLPRIGVPTLVLAGTEDAAMPVAASEKIVSLVPGARLAALSAGHQAAVEQPDAFHRTWKDFTAALHA